VKFDGGLGKEPDLTKKGKKKKKKRKNAENKGRAHSVGGGGLWPRL